MFELSKFNGTLFAINTLVLNIEKQASPVQNHHNNVDLPKTRVMSDVEQTQGISKSYVCLFLS
ncbi:hypothetical protein RO3G_10344 [Rhizopus delemar RA 99-880]|uniref:Uncharacterized protein n=1 Tax=Rhizopus delemar (strain RA 99-880 / ATCC MYA-4621 / FGSC 9543 / NRRL 43880) TaxID=246409 RepID=I1CB04_RHIO9|nr:hypothetical protein RO3G_10344 [Rhizopus delemar RA 99-880]|eukprot:EIE85634.1 hypothetical protein RO3G_10344 [Rhizopus delemar RA 99-880]